MPPSDLRAWLYAQHDGAELTAPLDGELTAQNIDTLVALLAMLRAWVTAGGTARVLVAAESPIGRELAADAADG